MQGTLFEPAAGGKILLPPSKEIIEPTRQKQGHRAERGERPWTPDGLRDYQITAIRNVEKDIRAGLKKLLVVSATGTGKCLGRGTPVLMFDGTIKPAEDVEIGDLVMGPDSKPRTVLRLSKGLGPLYKVRQKKGIDYVVNERHVLSLKMTNSGKPTSRYGEVVNISIPEYLSSHKTFKHMAKGYKAVLDWDEKPVYVHPYYLGLWLGDGTSRTPCVTTGDEEVELFLDCYAAVLNLRTFRFGQKKGCQTVGIRGKEWRNNTLLKGLKHYNLLQNKHIPQEYKCNSRRVRLQVLAGIIDSDGSYTCKCYDVVFKNQRLAEDTAFLARSLGFTCDVKPCQKTCMNNGAEGTYYRMHISGNTDEIPVTIARKKSSKRLQKKNNLVCGITVEPIGEGTYYGFEVDGDHLFCLGDMTVTHNSLMMAKMTERFYKMWGHGILIIAHRRNLITQLEQNFPPLGIMPCMEMGDRRGIAEYGMKSKVVIGTVQSLAGDRLEQWRDADFKLILIDESHRSINKSYYDIVNMFPGAIVIGFTATAIGSKKGGKQRNLGRFYQKVSFEYPLKQAIEDGVLCRIEAFPVKLNPPIDLRKLVVREGEYTDKELDHVIQNHLGSIVLAIKQYKALIDYDGTPMRAVAFAPLVRSAKAFSDALNSVGITADWICGDKSLCPHPEKKMAAHKRGEFQVLVNVGMLVEGHDDPLIKVIIMLRPFLSPVPYWQALGRGTRPYPSMQNNTKKFCRVVDLCFVTGKHSPINSTSLRDDSQDETPEEKEIQQIATELAMDAADRGEGVDVLDVVEKAKAIFIEREKIKIREREVRARVMVFDPLAARETLGMKPMKPDSGFGSQKPATPAQIRVLERHGIVARDGVSGRPVTFQEAQGIITTINVRGKFKLALPKQIKWCIDLGCPPGQARRMTQKQASEYIDANRRR